jgi:hypothetical protein
MEPAAPGTLERYDYEPWIQAFVERAATDQRDGTMITADSAEWYVEAALNFSQANLAIDHTDQEVDSVTYTIPLNNGMASEADAATAFNALNAMIAQSNVPDISHVVIVDVTSQNRSNELVLTTAYVVGSGYQKALNTSYGPNDYWMWISTPNSSACLPNTQISSQGADKRIQSRVRAAINNGNYVYMVSIETWTVVASGTSIPSKEISYTDFPVTGSPYGYRTYGCSGIGCDGCLSPSQMSFFTQGTWDVMNLIRQQHCPTKYSSNCTVQGDLTPCMDCSELFHWIQYRYGKFPKS